MRQCAGTGNRPSALQLLAAELDSTTVCAVCIILSVMLCCQGSSTPVLVVC